MSKISQMKTGTSENYNTNALCNSVKTIIPKIMNNILTIFSLTTSMAVFLQLTVIKIWQFCYSLPSDWKYNQFALLSISMKIWHNETVWGNHGHFCCILYYWQSYWKFYCTFSFCWKYHSFATFDVVPQSMVVFLQYAFMWAHHYFIVC